MTPARPTSAATPRPYPLWSRALGERSARLPCAVPVDHGSRTTSPRDPDTSTRPRDPDTSTRSRSARSWGRSGWWLVIAVRMRSAASRVPARIRSRGDRGDVPGWVLVTLMTAGLVLVLWGVARDRLTEVFNNAIDGVIGGAR